MGCDSVYGHNSAFRTALQAEGIVYMAGVPRDKPVVAIRETPAGKPGRPFSRWRVAGKVDLWLCGA